MTFGRIDRLVSRNQNETFHRKFQGQIAQMRGAKVLFLIASLGWLSIMGHMLVRGGMEYDRRPNRSMM